MKTWTKFIGIPLIILTFINVFLNFTELQFSSDSIFSISIVIFQLLIFIIVPYSMLALAPQHPYISTLCYMTVLASLIYFTRMDIYNQSFYQKGLFLLSGMTFWTITAIAIYFFYKAPQTHSKQLHSGRSRTVK